MTVRNIASICNMGTNASALEKDIGPEQFPINEHYFGLVNFGNTCYCNSVLQALYFCRPFRENVLAYKAQQKKKENLLTCLADLFHSIATQKKKVGVIPPKKFISRLRKENDLFDNYMQQDTHEFLNYLLNTVADILLEEKKLNTVADILLEEKKLNMVADILLEEKKLNTVADILLEEKKLNMVADILLEEKKLNTVADILLEEKKLNTMADILLEEKKQEKQNGRLKNNGTAITTETELENKTMEPTWVHDIFQGTLTNETRCLNCETVSSKDEDFLDLSVDVEQNTSITHCLRDFSNTETLCSEYKYYCETCCSKQEAQKRMCVKKLPMILALHLKRFKYMEQLHRYTKLSYRVVFPLELRLFNTSGDSVNLDRMYDLVAVVIHCGSGPNRGHYITIVKSHGFWLLFDYGIVEKIDAQAIEEFYGLTSDISKNSESGYILFYQSRE
ncbi:ubiquitin carboxyl-terminal hydrolase 12-B-like [Oncorhynchus nerka]|uniref:ubiquitin carboxyl-terminal hydrolase 12-B-like n=1 Tax=Oncorhynchus nerka TaxID=8023 RepID=UPI0031B834BB